MLITDFKIAFDNQRTPTIEFVYLRVASQDSAVLLILCWFAPAFISASIVHPMPG